MKKFIAAVLLGAGILVQAIPADAISGTVDSVQRGYVSVSYTAEKEVAPDTAEVSIAVKTEDKKSMQEAVRKNKEISDKVYSYLKSSINTANGDYIKTSNYSASPRYIYRNGVRSLDKYQVSNNIIVHTKSIDKIASYIDKSLTLGATDVDSLNFSLSEKDAQCVDLLTNASKQARKRADIVAAASGSAVTGIKSIDTSCSVNRYNNAPQFRNTLMMAKSMDASGSSDEEASPANIEAGTIKIYSTINASYYLK